MAQEEFLKQEDYLSIVDGYCFYNWMESGIREVTMYIKVNYSETDTILVRFKETGEKELINGNFLSTSLEVVKEVIVKEMEEVIKNHQLETLELGVKHKNELLPFNTILKTF